MRGFSAYGGPVFLATACARIIADDGWPVLRRLAAASFRKTASASQSVVACRVGAAAQLQQTTDNQAKSNRQATNRQATVIRQPQVSTR